MFFDLMPIRRLRGAASRRVGPCEPAAGLIRSLLMRRWVFLINENAFRYEVYEFFVALVTQKQRFPAIADEDQCAMRDRAFRQFEPQQNSFEACLSETVSRTIDGAFERCLG